METKMDLVDRNSIDSLIGKSWSFEAIPSIDRAGGIIMAWDDSKLAVQPILKHNQIILAEIILSSNSKFNVGGVYADTDPYRRRELWNTVSPLLPSPSPFLIGGDFNVLIDQSEKKGGKPFSTNMESEDFLDFMLSGDLHDLGFTGPAFTWCNNKDYGKRIWERLDRVLGNSSALDLWPGITIKHLPRIASDHCPLLVVFEPHHIPASSIRFEDAWLSFEEAHSIVQATWHRSEEIQSAVSSLASNRAPGIDGLTGSFFKRYWSTISSDVVTAILYAFEKGQLPQSWKDTAVTLVPKIPHAFEAKHFRPISLCNTIYKIIAKILVHRLKPLLPSLISIEQGAFIPGRSISDNCILAQELIHKLHTSEASNGLFLIKADMEQAFDRISWLFLDRMLNIMAFPPTWRKWIMMCVTNPRYTILINGRRSAWITERRPSKDDFTDLLAKIRNRIHSWGTRQLSLAGRLTLINSVLSSTPVYILSHIFVPCSVLDCIEKLLRSFLWGGNEDTNTMHYLPWKDVCKPKSCGGLGIHDLRLWRKQLLAKHAAKLLQKDDCIWRDSFIAKYKDRALNFSAKKGDSWIWRLICLSGSVVHNNLIWLIATGVSVSIWKDPWISTIPLCKWPTYINSNPGDLVSTVADLLNENTWNLTRLQQLFGVDLINRILSIRRLAYVHSDTLVWAKTESSSIPTAALYKAEFHQPNSLESGAWCWRAKVIPRVQIFVWRMAHNAVPTFQWLFNRKISNSNLCPWGCRQVEDLNHISIYCNFLQETRLHISKHFPLIPQDYTWENKLTSLANLTSLHRDDIKLRLELTLLYLCWRARCAKVHGKLYSNPPTLAISIINYTTSQPVNLRPSRFLWSQPSPLRLTYTFEDSWLPPKSGWLKVNLDGSIKGHGVAGVGYLIRDSYGQVWEAGGRRTLTDSILKAELLAAWEGVKAATSWRSKVKGVKGIWLESDSTEMLDLITYASNTEKRNAKAEMDFIAQQIADHLFDFSLYTMSHLCRNANGASDFLAHLASSSDFTWVGGMSLPNNFCHLLLQDAPNLHTFYTVN
ncbi:Putative ribonuclease H protein [Apostasia shenzhenica]|uniref:Ribonuclease H protein n=1 Tax=Apostasia shenzhenica TaxID=1088818 RepID=A0A2I0ARQ3_9ASPA|nr:Putative ribonuclease H protein [Apostasia shenzhenica]